MTRRAVVAWRFFLQLLKAARHQLCYWQPGDILLRVVEVVRSALLGMLQRSHHRILHRRGHRSLAMSMNII